MVVYIVISICIVLLTLWVWWLHSMMVEIARVVNHNTEEIEKFMRKYDA